MQKQPVKLPSSRPDAAESLVALSEGTSGSEEKREAIERECDPVSEKKKPEAASHCLFTRKTPEHTGEKPRKCLGFHKMFKIQHESTSQSPHCHHEHCSLM